jgi:hypothetical protein
LSTRLLIVAGNYGCDTTEYNNDVKRPIVLVFRIRVEPR